MRIKLMLVLALALSASVSMTACQADETTTGETTTDETAVEMPASEDAGEVQDEQSQDDSGEAQDEDGAAEDGEVTDDESDEAMVDDSSAMAGARVFAIIPEQSMASYEADEVFFQGAVDRLGVKLGDFHAVGTTGDVGGELVVNLNGAPAIAGGEIVVNLTSLTSDNDGRDNKLREEWLESMLYPEAVFTVTGTEGLPASYTEGDEITFTLLGDLTVRGITVPVEWTVTAAIEGNMLTGMAETTVSIPDFGFEAPDMAGFLNVADVITLKVDLTAQAQ